MIRENTNLSTTVLVDDKPVLNIFANITAQTNSCSITTEVIDRELYAENKTNVDSEYQAFKLIVASRLAALGMEVLV